MKVAVIGEGGHVVSGTLCGMRGSVILPYVVGAWRAPSIKTDVQVTEVSSPGKMAVLLGGFNGTIPS